MHTANDNTKVRAKAIVGAAKRAIASVVAASRRRAAIRELQGWDDRLLKDIGISRGEIAAAVDAVGRGDAGETRSPAAPAGRDAGGNPGRQAA